jgi:hypothetical protein
VLSILLVIVFPVRSRAPSPRGRDRLFSVLLSQLDSCPISFSWLWFSPAPRVYAPVSTRINFCRYGICFMLPSTLVLIFPLCFFRSASGFGRPHVGSAACLIFPLSWQVPRVGQSVSPARSGREILFHLQAFPRRWLVFTSRSIVSLRQERTGPTR